MRRSWAAVNSILKQFGCSLEHRNLALVLQAARALEKLRSLLSVGCLRARLVQQGHYVLRCRKWRPTEPIGQGQTDCALFVNHWVLLCSPETPAPPRRPLIGQQRGDPLLRRGEPVEGLAAIGLALVETAAPIVNDGILVIQPGAKLPNLASLAQ